MTTYAKYHGARFPNTSQVVQGVVYGPSGSNLTGSMNILPSSDKNTARRLRGQIVIAVGELITITREVLDVNRNPLSLVGRTLQVVIQDARGVDIATVPNSAITIGGSSNNAFSFAVPANASARVGNFTYALNDVGSSKAELARGDWIVESRPLADS